MVFFGPFVLLEVWALIEGMLFTTAWVETDATLSTV
jgi:hypothetical protein